MRLNPKKILGASLRHPKSIFLISDLNNLAYNTPGVLSVVDIALFNKSGIEQDRKYSSTTFDVRDGTLKGMVFPPPGGIFEVKFPDFDIIGSAV